MAPCPPAPDGRGEGDAAVKPEELEALDLVLEQAYAYLEEYGHTHKTLQHSTDCEDRDCRAFNTIRALHDRLADHRF